MIKNLHPVHVSLSLACVIWLVACSNLSLALAPVASDSKRPHFVLERQRESELQRAWEGQPYDSLLAAYGTPKLVMDVPGFRQLKTTVAVYGVNDQASNCIDAFSLIEHSQTKQLTVADYFCR